MKFQDDISNMNTYIHTYVHTYGQAETNMPPHFFKVGGITNGQLSELLFHKRWQLSNTTRTRNNINTRKVKRHRNSDTKIGNREPQQNNRFGTVSTELLGGFNWFDGPTSPSVSVVVQSKTFSWLFGSLDNPLTRQ